MIEFRAIKDDVYVIYEGDPAIGYAHLLCGDLYLSITVDEKGRDTKLGRSCLAGLSTVRQDSDWLAAVAAARQRLTCKNDQGEARRP
jgi:hypothetical protein